MLSTVSTVDFVLTPKTLRLSQWFPAHDLLETPLWNDTASARPKKKPLTCGNATRVKGKRLVWPADCFRHPVRA
jgi:hypothetical protein